VAGGLSISETGSDTGAVPEHNSHVWALQQPNGGEPNSGRGAGYSRFGVNAAAAFSWMLDGRG